MNDAQVEGKYLAQLKRIFDDPEGVARSNNIKKIVFLIAGVGLMMLGMYLSKEGVIQGLCDILVCLSGICLTYFFFLNSMNQTHRILTRYTQLDRDLVEERLSSLVVRSKSPGFDERP